MGSNIVWQNTQIPGFGGALSAANQSVNSFNKIVGNFKQGLIDKEDRKIAADDRAFKREGDLLQRDLTNQKIEQGAYDFGNREEDRENELLKFNAALANTQSNTRNSNASNARSQYTFDTNKKDVQDEQTLTAEINRIKLANPDISQRDLMRQTRAYMKDSGIKFSPTSSGNAYKNLSGGYENTSGEKEVANALALDSERKFKTDMQNSKNEAKVTAAKLKADAYASRGKNGKPPVPWGTTPYDTAGIDIAVNGIQDSDFDGMFNTDAETQTAVHKFLAPYNKALGYRNKGLIEKHTDSSGKFNSKAYMKDAELLLPVLNAKYAAGEEEKRTNQQIFDGLKGK